MANRSAKLRELLEPCVTALGYELIEVEHFTNPKNALLRLYIDRPEGIALEDCEKVSRDVSELLDATDPINAEYSLEVSSPGLDRILRTAEHFEQFAGEQVSVLLKVPLEGRRKFKGRIVTAKGDSLRLALDGSETDLSIRGIERARLVPDFDA